MQPLIIIRFHGNGKKSQENETKPRQERRGFYFGDIMRLAFALWSSMIPALMGSLVGAGRSTMILYPL
jgi:hypothetical protein